MPATHTPSTTTLKSPQYRRDGGGPYAAIRHSYRIVTRLKSPTCGGI